jgi:hypothetical protein
MYTLNVKNDFIWPITSNEGTVIAASGGSHSFQKQGSIILDVLGMGAFTFIDLGDTKLEGYPEVKETWGVLLRTHTSEAYYRYEGGGNLTANFDNLGTCTLSTTNGTLIPISLEELNVTISGIQ